MLQEKYTDTFESIIYLIGVLVTNIPLRPNFSNPPNKIENVVSEYM